MPFLFFPNRYSVSWHYQTILCRKLLYINQWQRAEINLTVRKPVSQVAPEQDYQFSTESGRVVYTRRELMQRQSLYSAIDDYSLIIMIMTMCVSLLNSFQTWLNFQPPTQETVANWILKNFLFYKWEWKIKTLFIHCISKTESHSRQSSPTVRENHLNCHKELCKGESTIWRIYLHTARP